MGDLETPENKADRSRKAILALIIYIAVLFGLLVLFGIVFGWLFPIKTFN